MCWNFFFWILERIFILIEINFLIEEINDIFWNIILVKYWLNRKGE